MSADTDATVAKLEQTWASLDTLLADLTDEQWATPTDLPGWTVHDVVSHLIGTEWTLAGRPPTDHQAPPADHVRNPIGQSAENEVDLRRGRTGGEELAELRAVVAERVAQLHAMSDDDFAAESWTPIGPGTLHDFLQIRVLDNWVHEQDIRRALGRPGHDAGPAAEHTLDRMLRTIGATFGKRAGAPDGASLVLTLTGPVPRSVLLEMHEGRARRLDAPPAAPTVSLTMSSGDFLVLVTGRRAPAAVPVEVAGDAALAAAVLGHLNQMI